MLSSPLSFTVVSGDGHLNPPPRRRAQRDIYKLDERIGRILLKTDQRDPLEVLWNSGRLRDRSNFKFAAESPVVYCHASGSNPRATGSRLV